MNLKTKISFIVSFLFTIIFAFSATIVYYLFADFRKDEFENRLKDKAVNSIKLLVEVEQVDRQLLKIIDQNSIDKLYEEKTLIFDANYYLIYSSLDDTKINWTIDDLDYLKKNKTFFRGENDKEVYGVFYDTNESDYYALISASDIGGKRKLEYLLFILIGTYIVFTILCWFITTYAVKKLLEPLSDFHSRLKGINENNLDTRIAVKAEKDEIDLLANEFNLMLQRIDLSYQKQKEFSAHASHELRTPIARVTSQLENRLLENEVHSETKSFLKQLLVDINQISDLISSLLLLSRLDIAHSSHDACRIDELIYESSHLVNKHFPNFTLQLEIKDSDAHDTTLEIKGNKSQLEIAFTNLLKNAYLYSDNNQAVVLISCSQNFIEVSISNTGPTLSVDEQTNLFQPFMRGQNALNKAGLGLGLRIVHRILYQHNATLAYESLPGEVNTFKVRFIL